MQDAKADRTPTIRNQSSSNSWENRNKAEREEERAENEVNEGAIWHWIRSYSLIYNHRLWKKIKESESNKAWD